MLTGRFILQRALWALITLALLSVAVFFLAQVLPGDLARQILGQYASDEQVALLNDQLGLDDPIVERYGRWIGGFVTLDWGNSPILGVSVKTVLLDAFVKSLVLGAMAFLIILVLSFALGIFAAKRPGTRRDTTVNLLGVALGGIPELVCAVILIAVFAVGLGWFPATAQSSSDSIGVALHHLALPALALVPTTAGYLLRIIRAQAIDVYSSDYVRTARLKGASPLRVDLVHGLKNIAGPAAPVMGANLIYLVTGVVAIERIFNYPALGSALFNAAIAKDVVVLTTGTMLAATCVIVINFLSDVVMITLNPRAKEQA